MTDLGKLGVEALRKMVERLQGEVDELKQKKEFGLVWDDEREDNLEEVVARCGRDLPVLEEVKGLAVSVDGDAPTNLLIEGDNYHALSVLNYTHPRKIDVIYIDPPYNTGKADEWRYNDDCVDKNDGYRHSKWLSMMAKRLTLAKNLLTKNGVIFVSIDDNEQPRLRMLMDEIFGESNFVNTIIWQRASGGGNAKGIITGHDYVLVYQKHKNPVLDFRGEEVGGRFSKEKTIVKDGKTFFIDDDVVRKVFGPYPRGTERRCYYEELSQYRGARQIAEINQKIESGEYMLVRQENGMHFIAELIEKGRRKKMYSIIQGVLNNHGAEEMDKLGLSFDYPKPVGLIKKLLRSCCKKDAVILDFFAGSGTTGHAVSVLNKEDDGNRRFILCTNNEGGIAREVCQPRIKAVIKGNANLPDITGIPSNLKFFKTAFVSAHKNPTDWDKHRLTEKAADMLCVRENTFDIVVENKTYRIYGDGRKRFTGIIYKRAAIAAFKKAAANLGGKISVYVFSLGDEDFSAEFADLKNKIKVRPIPQVILGVYREIFRKGAKR